MALSTHPSQVPDVQLVTTPRIRAPHVVVVSMVVVVVATGSGSATSHASATSICLARLAVPARTLIGHAAPARWSSVRGVPVVRLALAARRHHHVVVQVHSAIAAGKLRVLEAAEKRRRG